VDLLDETCPGVRVERRLYKTHQTVQPILEAELIAISGSVLPDFCSARDVSWLRAVKWEDDNEADFVSFLQQVVHKDWSVKLQIVAAEEDRGNVVWVDASDYVITQTSARSHHFGDVSNISPGKLYTQCIEHTNPSILTKLK